MGKTKWRKEESDANFDVTVNVNSFRRPNPPFLHPFPLPIAASVIHPHFHEENA